MKVTCLSILFFILATTSAVAGSNTISSVNILREEYIQNPIFQSDTYIFEAGQSQQKTIFLIHGIGDEASSIWRSLAADLSRNYHIVAIDLPGFGRSEKANDLYSPQRYVELIDWLINKYSSGKIILAGHSLGGALALNYASGHPEKVSHLVLIDVAGILHRIALTKNFLYINPPAGEQNVVTGFLANILKKPIKILNHLTGSTIENLESESSDTGLELIMEHDGSRKIFLGGNSSAVAGLALAQENFSEIIEKTIVPTSLIWGRQDEITPLRTGKLLAAKLANSRLRIIENVGHVPMLEQPKEFLNILREELGSPPEKISASEIANDSQRVAVCQKQNDVVFSGNFDRIQITDCQGVTLRNVRAHQIQISHSEVEIENSAVHSNQSALVLQHAKVIGTNLLLEGDIAIESSSSRLDLAGAELFGRTAAIQTKDKTFVLFSISKAASPHTNAKLHGVIRITPDKPL